MNQYQYNQYITSQCYVQKIPNGGYIYLYKDLYVFS